MDNLPKPKTESEKRYFGEIKSTIGRMIDITLLPEIMEVRKKYFFMELHRCLKKTFFRYDDSSKSSVKKERSVNKSSSRIVNLRA